MFMGNMKTPRTHKHLDLLRGPEEIHNYLIHNQYGIVVSAEIVRIHAHSCQRESGLKNNLKNS